MRASNSAVERIALRDGELRYWPALFMPADADRLFAELRERIAWEQHHVRLFGRRVPSPRLSAWYGDPGAVYTYSGERHEPRPWLPPLLEIRVAVEAACSASFDSVLANRYRDGGDSMGWHSDDEPELGRDPVIASVSFGAARRFLLRHRRHPDRFALTLAPGSLLVMHGPTQHDWRHALPKTRRPVGERINLTFRAVGGQFLHRRDAATRTPRNRPLDAAAAVTGATSRATGSQAGSNAIHSGNPPDPRAMGSDPNCASSSQPPISASPPWLTVSPSGLAGASPTIACR